MGGSSGGVDSGGGSSQAGMTGSERTADSEARSDQSFSESLSEAREASRSPNDDGGGNSDKPDKSETDKSDRAAGPPGVGAPPSSSSPTETDNRPDDNDDTDDRNFIDRVADTLSAPPTDAEGNARSSSPVADRIGNHTQNYTVDDIKNAFAADEPPVTAEQSKALEQGAAVMNGYAFGPAIPSTVDMVLGGMMPSAPGGLPATPIGQTLPEEEQGFSDYVGNAASYGAGVVVGAGERAVELVSDIPGAAWEGVSMVNDAAGMVLDTAVGWTGIGFFEGHTQRHVERGQAMYDGIVGIPDQVVEGWESFNGNLGTGNYYDAGRQTGSLGLDIAGIAVPASKIGALGRVDDVAAVSTVDRTLDAMYSAGPAAKAEIDTLAREIAMKNNARVAEAPLKSRARAAEKAEIDYDGDATRVNDIARNTIVASKDRIGAVTEDLRSNGARVKEITPESNPAGYSGVNTVIETKAGIKAEIQVNTPDMVYAKEPEPVARSILGDEAYDEIAERTGIPGGRGHDLYEEIRSLDADDAGRARELERESREYYKNFQ